MKSSSVKSDIIRVMSIFGLAIGCAFLLAIYMIRQHGPLGGYLAGHTLLSPEVLKTFHYQERYAKKTIEYVFHGIEFSYFDTLNSQLQNYKVNSIQYARFYQTVAEQKSVLNLAEAEQAFIKEGLPATLTVFVQVEHKPQAFQLVQFLTSDFFRVQLQNKQEWAYFYQPGLYQEVKRLFVTPS